MLALSLAHHFPSTTCLDLLGGLPLSFLQKHVFNNVILQKQVILTLQHQQPQLQQHSRSSPPIPIIQRVVMTEPHLHPYFVCVCVCVCVPGIHHVMRTKCPHKYSNTSKFWPCGDIFRSPWGNKLINHTEWSVLKIWNSRMFPVRVRFRCRVGVVW